ncbi:phage major capsid protein [Streptomyces sp. ISL-96]|uniref:phage major capsid protein n=1 Tax=Streptomyces sp. ISL-96 TaxID=2819191 RepID=UPI001BEA7CD6|nr:phage major capsid protein [Streptomyces sp. ISL-96]MBT2491514.1 phage major capsid protein [Streptomyces sp. ISL-96]
MNSYFPALEAKKAELKRIIDEAGQGIGFDLGRVKCISGTHAEILGHIKKLNHEIDALTATHDAVNAGRYAAESGDGARIDAASYAAYGAPRGGLQGALTLAKGQSVSRWMKSNGHSDPDTENLSFDRYLKGLVTGNWKGADAERKAMNEGTLTAGGHVVPTPLAGSIIDMARNQMRVAQAGATFVPMTSSTLKVPRLTGEGTPAWRNENAAITDTDLAFDAVTFQAHSMARMVKLSRELFEDSDPSAEGIIAHSFAQQIALELDRVALRGSGTAPEPRGVLNASGITITTHGANGAAITNYDWWLDAVGTIRNNNFEPNAQIQAPRSETSLSKLKDAQNAYLAPPAALANILRLNTKQVPTNLTVGTSTDCSEIYTADWRMLGIGIRTGFELEFLRERYADNLQVAFLAHLRADVQLFQPTAFVVDTGVRA